MKRRIKAMTLLLTFATAVTVSAVRTSAASIYDMALMSAMAATPDYRIALANQANQAAVAANAAAIQKQQQADQALMLALAANQNAYSKQADAAVAALNAAAANQAVYNTIAMNNPLLYRPVLQPAYVVDPRARNLELLHNINTIDQARIAATNARATANMTLTRLNDVNALLNATKIEVTKNPGLTQRLNELTAISNNLTAQYNQQNSDATSKEETYKRLQATLPTAGYNPCYWKCYY